MRVRHSLPIKKSRRSGFTLIELLVVISIIAVLASLVLPGVQQARATARRTQCLNNMRNIGIAMQTYATDHRGNLPPLAGGDFIENGASPIAASWAVHLLPYVEQRGLYDRLLDTDLRAGQGLVSLRSTNVEVYTCPDDPNDGADGAMSYVVNGGYAVTDVWQGTAPAERPLVHRYVWPTDTLAADDPTNVNITAATGAFFYEDWATVDWSPAGFKNSLDKVTAGDGLSQTIFLSENLDTNDFNGTFGGFSAVAFGDLAFAVPVAGGYDAATDVSTPTAGSANGGYGDPSSTTPPALATSLQTARQVSSMSIFPAIAGRNDAGKINSELGIAPAGGAPRPSSLHSGSVNVIFGDGSGRNIAENVDDGVYVRLVSSNGNRYGQQILSNGDY